MPFPQYSSALFLNSSTELLFYPCCASCGLATHTVSFSSTLLSLFSPSCTFSLMGCTSLFSCYTFCDVVTYATFFIRFHSGHSLHLCSSSPHLKHSISTLFCFLIILSFTSHCIILLDNTLNLFLGAVPLFSFFSLFLQFWARCPNPLQLQHSRSFFSSSFALNEIRACFCLRVWK